MSFGFSAGDFIAAANLIKDITSAIKGTSRSEYRALERELHALQRALFEIEHLKTPTGQETAVNAVKAASLMCQYPLDEFLSKLKRYEAEFSDRVDVNVSVVKRLGKSMRWKFEMEEEVLKLRAYISGHVGSLNMRLTTLGLGVLFSSVVVASEREGIIEAGLERQKDLLHGNSQMMRTLYEILTGKLLPQLQALTELVGKVWASNLQILSYISNIQNGPMNIDIRHTWFQEPIKLEDALGRLIPIAPEYGWTTFQAIIKEQFKSGPGNEKGQAGEYELFCTEDSSKNITEQTLPLLGPGASITMAIVIGRYKQGPKNICPRPGCISKLLTKCEAGGMICDKCHAWFGETHRPFLKPFLWFDPQYLEEKRLENSNGEGGDFLQDIIRKMREDRKWFKNFRVDFTDMPTVLVVQDWQPTTARNSPTITCSNRRNRQTHLNRALTTQELDRQWSAITDIIRSTLEPYFTAVQPDDETPLRQLGLDSMLAADVAYRVKRDFPATDLHLAHFLERGATFGSIKSSIYHGTTTVV